MKKNVLLLKQAAQTAQVVFSVIREDSLTIIQFAQKATTVQIPCAPIFRLAVQWEASVKKEAFSQPNAQAAIINHTCINLRVSNAQQAIIALRLIPRKP